MMLKAVDYIYDPSPLANVPTTTTTTTAPAG